MVGSRKPRYLNHCTPVYTQSGEIGALLDRVEVVPEPLLVIGVGHVLDLVFYKGR